MKKTLYLHIGGCKTGSSAIQNYLERNHQLLNLAGISYNKRVNITDPQQITSGNGMNLYLGLFHEESDAAIEHMLFEYMGKNNRAVCSSEILMYLTAQQLNRLFVIALKNDILIHVIFYIRNVIPYFASLYDQAIKREAVSQSFYHFIQETKYDHWTILTDLVGNLDFIDLTVIHYESVKSNIIGSFLECLSYTNSNVRNENEIQVNRSLNTVERKTLRALNRKFGYYYGNAISDYVLYNAADIPSDTVQISQKEYFYIYEKYTQIVDQINLSFFGNEPILSIGHIKNNPPYISIDYKKKLHELIRQFFIDEKKRLEDIHLVVAKYEDELIAADALLPSDFNLYDYLVLNPDIYESKINPVEHYLLCGSRERRLYSRDDN